MGSRQVSAEECSHVRWRVSSRESEVVPCSKLVAVQTSAKSFVTWVGPEHHIDQGHRFVGSYLASGNQAVEIGEQAYSPCLPFEDTCRVHLALASGHRREAVCSTKDLA